ncbi:hypothetical protein SAMN05421829_108125 [Aromatoleum tolulyticum]|uniref:Uncharacterized protein n=1 Tax=Aromatoleum tolulyticum TaxID=34027 RepID=A0A1N6WYT8_9RHOO|nr:hypothetical protein [Aromatoleum tolulyticum]SIQ95181.1 hypothetical protein SAMN05421829_108125 [Aromatoleum tolulyticum]
MSEEEKTAQILQLFKAGATPAPRRRSAAAKSVQITVNGAVSGQIVGGDVNNYTVARPPRPRVVVTPGDGVVTEEQKARINALRIDWIALHNSIKRAPLTDAAAWIRINRKAGVTSYHLIPAERFDLVVKFIKQEMAKLRAMPSAPSKDDDWRRSRISAIKARCKNQLGDADAYKSYIRKNFSLESLADLSTDQLRRTHSYIMGKEPAPPEFPAAPRDA